MADPEYEALQSLIGTELYHPNYVSNNYYAYYHDLLQVKPAVPAVDIEQHLRLHTKLDNFVPTYDKWCLYCGYRAATKRCSGCKAVFFCDRECQTKAWGLHKKHCGRELFQICITCGQLPESDQYHCPHCPVKYCSDKCQAQIHSLHLDYDCKYFGRTFNPPSN